MKYIHKIKISLYFLLFTFSINSYAYLDPGSASLLIQGLIAAIASVATGVTIYWTKIKLFFTKQSDDKDSEIKRAADKDKTNNPE